jgi:hypothetical protein
MIGIETMLMSNAMSTVTLAQPGTALAILAITGLAVSGVSLLLSPWRRALPRVSWMAPAPAPAR